MWLITPLFFFLALLTLNSFSLFGVNNAHEEALSKRVNAHIVIKDYHSACLEAQAALKLYPDSKILAQAAIKALAKMGDEKNMFLQWNHYSETFPEELTNREILEAMAWSVIDQGSSSSSPIIRIMSMIGAFLSQDTKGVSILLKNLRDVNSQIRSVAIQLSSEYSDAKLQDEIKKILQTESCWNVRLEAIRAVGKMGIEEVRPNLISLISSNRATTEEKVAAIESLVILSEKLDRNQLQRLIQSNRAGLRLLACEFVRHFEQIDDLDLLLPLLKDSNAEVRAKTLQTLGVLRIPTVGNQSISSIVENFVFDHDPLVATSAAWVLTIHSSEVGKDTFKRLILNESQDMRLLAATALAATGSHGIDLILEQFQASSDIYVKMNLALGMISQRSETKLACDCLFSGLSRGNEKWMWSEKGLFRVLAPSTIKYDDGVSNYPEAINQLARLEILNILSIMHYPYAQHAIKNFLQQKSWGVSGLASALLLTEGDEEAITLVQSLLDDQDGNVKIQAALILALWGEGESAINILIKAYPHVGRELKERILEGIAKIGTPVAIPFLVEKLQEPSQSLRIIAASALLSCLYK